MEWSTCNGWSGSSARLYPKSNWFYNQEGGAPPPANAGGFRAVPRKTMRPLGLVQVPLRMGWAPPQLELSQAAVPFKVVVIDVRGNGFSGVRVALSDGQTAITDSDGAATFANPPKGQVDVTLDNPEFRIVRRGDTNQTLFVDLPVCGTPRILTNTELIALVAGGAIAAAGVHWKISALSVTGEILVGA